MTDTLQDEQTDQDDTAAQEAAAREAEAKKQEDEARAKAEYEAQPRIRLQKILTGLHGNHTDVRDHLGFLTRAMAEVVGMLHAQALEAQPLAPVDEPPVSDTPPAAPAAWPKGA